MIVYRHALRVGLFRLRSWQESAKDTTLSGCSEADSASMESTGTGNEKRCNPDRSLHSRTTAR